MKTNHALLSSRPEIRQEVYGELGGIRCTHCAETNPLQARYCMQCGAPMRPAYTYRKPRAAGLFGAFTGANHNNALLALGCLKDLIIGIIFLSLLLSAGVNLNWDTLDDRILLCGIFFVLVTAVSIFAKLVNRLGGTQ